MAMMYPFRLSRRVTGPLAVAFCVLAFSGTGFAQNLGAVMDRLERLERDIRTLNIQISRGPNAAGAKTSISAAGDKKISGANAVLITQRLDSLEQDIRSATGSMEQLGHQVFQLTERLDKLVGDVDFRLGALEAKMGGESSASLVPTTPHSVAAKGTYSAPNGVSAVPSDVGSGAKVSLATAAPLPTIPAQGPQTLGTVSAKAVEDLRKPKPRAATVARQPTSSAAAPVGSSTPLTTGTPKEQYAYALDLLKKTNYGQAEIVLIEFITTQGGHSLAGNARYWLGETYYVRADYEQAAQTFFQGYQASPSNVKAPDMLLKLGMSLAQLKKKTEACATFDKLSQDFPGASTRIISAVSRERKRAGC